MTAHRIPATAVALASAFVVDAAAAHGFAGKRFFPATLAVEDPFVADELSLPTVSYFKNPPADEGPATRETSIAVDFSKRITEDFGLAFGASYLQLRPQEGERQRGFDNFALGAKYKVFQDDAREAIVSLGLDWDIGGSGSKRVGAEPYSTVTPGVLFGKGFGDLGDDAKYLRPLAITGVIGVGIPSRSSVTGTDDEGNPTSTPIPTTLQWGITLQYSLPYLNANVEGTGWDPVFNQLIPVIEFPMTTSLDRGVHGTTGTVNPGLIWAGRYLQVAAEAQIPVNRATGSQVGWIVQLHFYLDDLFPGSLGRPLLGR